MELKGTKTEQNLCTAFAGESQARNKYTYFASVAKKEGYEQIAEIFTKTAENVELQKVFEKSEETMWECRNCGHLVIGKKAPAVCPVCAHPQSYFEVRKENY